MIPAPVIEEIEGVLVVRDDRVPGGTKRRVLPQILDDSGEHVYASPAQGFAQLALAYTCRDMATRATIFTAQRRHLHDRTLQCAALGAHIVPVPYGYLSNVKAKAAAHADRTGAQLLPFGLDCEEFIRGLAAVGQQVAARVPNVPEVWTVAGSGVLSRALQRAFPIASFHAVQIGHKLSANELGRAQLWEAPESFESIARQPPPFPSCDNYDAKAWRFIKQHAKPGALFWNTA